jgi:hypothetical protein
MSPKQQVNGAQMRLAGAVGLLLGISFPAAAQWTEVRLPDRVYTAIPFMVDIGLDCPPADEVPPPPGCRGTTGVWFAADERSAVLPQGFVTLFPFAPARAGPFIFHKPGEHRLDVFAYSRENIGEIDLVGRVTFTVEPPGLARKKQP